MPEEKSEIMNRKSDESETLSEELSEALEDMPPDVRKHVEKFMISSVQMGGVYRPENTISKKITEQHISQFLEDSRVQMKEDYKEKRESKIFSGIVLILILVFIIVVILLLKDNPEVMEKVLYSLVGLLAGALGGYGYGKTKKDE